ncbi:hypothetical protein ACFY1P_15570 [Streptomyces sp. NPDC001407]|uniref:hypothetical protein n=1 Tax=Streptomyces sp. NPDC001407 TaxID=3364573 RepID=UPI0036879329
MPLHAAGLFVGDVPVTGENVLDRVVSSYAPTLRSLWHARRVQHRTARRACYPSPRPVLLAVSSG